MIKLAEIASFLGCSVLVPYFDPMIFYLFVVVG